LESDSETPAFEQAANRGRRYAFAEGGNNAAGNEDILRCHPLGLAHKHFRAVEPGFLLQTEVGVQRILRSFIRVVNFDYCAGIEATFD